MGITFFNCHYNTFWSSVAIIIVAVLKSAVVIKIAVVTDLQVFHLRC